MCGIIGYTGNLNATEVVLEGLRRLEYRGYDSAGIAFFRDNSVEIKRCRGKIKDLVSLIDIDGDSSSTAIGHTRWATHGKPSDENAHPHRAGRIILVHNGIIENYIELKMELMSRGKRFNSETDTEVLCHLIDEEIEGRKLEDAMEIALKRVRGAYAIAVMNEDEPGKIVAVRKDCPLVIGVSKDGYFIASDIPAFLNYSRNVIFLDDGEMAILEGNKIIIKRLQDGSVVSKQPVHIEWSAAMAEKGGFKHFMLKEIFEQPQAISDTMRGMIYPEKGEINLEELNLDVKFIRNIKRILIIACGTSYHAGLIGRYIFEELARLPVSVEIASEFRYRNPVLVDGTLVIGISQSGETADTLQSIRWLKSMNYRILSICNVVGSSIARESDGVFYTHAGPEIGVASTKAFTSQIVALYILATGFARVRGIIDSILAGRLLRELMEVPDKIQEIFKGCNRIEEISKLYSNRKGFLFLGRDINYPVALEGALKLKEISYIHAEGYPAGEMKHGPIALIDNELPVVFIIPGDGIYEKTLSNMQEVKSRDGIVISVVTKGDRDATSLSNHVIEIPPANKYLNTILSVIPLQLLAYHIGVIKGYDVDQPRNLAKSVTVE